MIVLNKLNTRTLFESLRRTKCPCCGGVKKPMQTFCSRDYYRLPPVLRQALYSRIGSGYAEAVVEALNFLEAEEFISPAPEVKDGPAPRAAKS